MIRVGVIRGGISPEYEVSLATGANVLSHLRSDNLNNKYRPIDIFIDKEGVFHMNGFPTTLEKIHQQVDVVWNALHGDFGEDGKVQQMLDGWNIKYTGSHAFSSALSYNKVLAKEQFKNIGIKTPEHILLPVYLADMDGDIESYAHTKAHEVFHRMPPPWIVKPFSGGSSVGIHVCKDLPSLVRAIRDVAESRASCMVEELIKGREATVGVVEGYRGEKLYALPPTEIHIESGKDHFDYDAKYSGKTREVCPGKFSEEHKNKLMHIAKLAHSALNLSHYSRSDFMIHPTKGIYLLEVNNLPGLTNESLLPKQLEAVGSSMPEFIDHILKISMSR